MEPEHKLYLYGGSTFILVPESAWLNELKSDPTGLNVQKSLEDILLQKGWIKVKQTFAPDANSESVTEWIYEETGAKLKTVVTDKGQLKINEKEIGPSTVADTYIKAAKMAEDSRLLKTWVAPAQEVKEAKEKAVTNKGGPHPIADVLTSSSEQKIIANMQLIGKYEPLIAKENLTPQERMQKINRLIEMAEKEENEMERQQLLAVVDRELDLLENSAAGR